MSGDEDKPEDMFPGAVLVTKEPSREGPHYVDTESVTTASPAFIEWVKNLPPLPMTVHEDGSMSGTFEVIIHGIARPPDRLFDTCIVDGKEITIEELMASPKLEALVTDAKRPPCEKCDGRGWYYTNGTRSYGAERCGCGAPLSEIGRVQIETRGKKGGEP